MWQNGTNPGSINTWKPSLRREKVKNIFHFVNIYWDMTRPSSGSWSQWFHLAIILSSSSSSVGCCLPSRPSWSWPRPPPSGRWPSPSRCSRTSCCPSTSWRSRSTPAISCLTPIPSWSIPAGSMTMVNMLVSSDLLVKTRWFLVPIMGCSMTSEFMESQDWFVNVNPGMQSQPWGRWRTLQGT